MLVWVKPGGRATLGYLGTYKLHVPLQELQCEVCFAPDKVLHGYAAPS